MTFDEKKQIQERLRVAEKLEARIGDLKNLAGLLTAQRDQDVSITDHRSGRQLTIIGPEDLLAGVRLQLKALEGELEKA